MAPCTPSSTPILLSSFPPPQLRGCFSNSLLFEADKRCQNLCPSNANTPQKHHTIRGWFTGLPWLTALPPTSWQWDGNTVIFILLGERELLIPCPWCACLTYPDGLWASVQVLANYIECSFNTNWIVQWWAVVPGWWPRMAAATKNNI